MLQSVENLEISNSIHFQPKGSVGFLSSSPGKSNFQVKELRFIKTFLYRETIWSNFYAVSWYP